MHHCHTVQLYFLTENTPIYAKSAAYYSCAPNVVVGLSVVELSRLFSRNSSVCFIRLTVDQVYELKA
jgi:hypothetical protein